MLSLLLTHYKKSQEQLLKCKSNLIEFCFPTCCLNCATIGSIVCSACLAKIELISEPICPQCSLKFSYPNQSCLNCAQHPTPTLQQIRAAGWFKPPLSHLIHHFKYHNLFALAVPLGKLLINQWEKWYTPVDLIIPIPLHPTRYRERGYNQSELLAQQFSLVHKIPISIDCLSRIRETTPQVGLDIKEREANLINAFSATTTVAGKRILLIDDVCTTGATLLAAANTLTAIGAKSVSAYCVARAI